MIDFQLLSARGGMLQLDIVLVLLYNLNYAICSGVARGGQ